MACKYSELYSFLDSAKSAYHTVENLKNRLLSEGFVRLYENDEWKLDEGGKYFVIRDGSSIIAFVNRGGAYSICASHSDSPAFRIKSDNESGAYLKLDTEKYGGMIYYTLFDRPLAIAGRAVVRSESGLEVKLFTLDKEVVIPSLAIHMNRTVNESRKFNPAQDLIPLAALGMKKGSLASMIAEKLSVDPGDIVSHETFLSPADEPRAIGFNDEFVLSPRLDDLGCVFTSLEGFLSAKVSGATPVFAVFDNEEVGSETKQGAASTFLFDTLHRISGGEKEFMRRIASSFMVSADNAHALHPNHPEMADRSNAPILGEGIVIKYNANQRYATDALSDAIFRKICEGAGVKVQSYFNRADLPGGSTLGSISDTKVSVPTVDIGIPQLAMHSANETCALADIDEMIKALTAFYSSVIEMKGENITIK
jgi:aspartyl aminopeptidase